MNRNTWMALLGVTVILSFVLSACAQATPTAAPKPAATSAPAQPAQQTQPAQPTQPPAAPASKYKQAPMLDDLVKSGKLPSVDQRLPANPAVVQGVVEGEPHIHITLSMSDGAFGGHLEPGCVAYVLCKVFFAEVEGVNMSRQHVPVVIEGMGEGEITRLVFDPRQNKV
jgi:hypothetical protein